MSTVTGQGLRVKSQKSRIKSQESRIKKQPELLLLLFDIDKITLKLNILTPQSNLVYISYADSPRLARHT